MKIVFAQQSHRFSVTLAKRFKRVCDIRHKRNKRKEKSFYLCKSYEITWNGNMKATGMPINIHAVYILTGFRFCPNILFHRCICTTILKLSAWLRERLNYPFMTFQHAGTE